MDYIRAFFIGGFICVIGQVLIDRTKLTPARILVSFVVAGAFLELFGLYSPLINYAGAGASVPLTGFGSVLTKGVVKAVNEKGILGIITGGISASAGGIASAIIFAFVMSLVFNSKAKK